MNTECQFGLFDDVSASLPRAQRLVFTPQSDDYDRPSISHIRHYLTSRQQQLLLGECASYPFSSPAVTVFGKSHPIPRQQVWFADAGCEYRYSGLLMAPTPWPHYVGRLLNQLNRELGPAPGREFNGCLVNRYRHGCDAMGFHADDEPELVSDAMVAIVSLGQSRPMLFRRNRDGLKYRLLLQAGDLLLMHPPMQSLWQHAIPKSRRALDERVSFTFRAILPFYHRPADD